MGAIHTKQYSQEKNSVSSSSSSSSSKETTPATRLQGARNDESIHRELSRPAPSHMLSPGARRDLDSMFFE